ncbi:MAG: dipeptidase [Planctomycetaceae bacterium]|nr:dipeptidase [Planctomycetaceae bacterium]
MSQKQNRWILNGILSLLWAGCTAPVFGQVPQDAIPAKPADGPAATNAATDEPAFPPIVISAEARRIHFAGSLFDGHNDLPWTMRAEANSSFDKVDIAQPTKFHTDIPRLKAGGLKAQFWSVYVPSSSAVTGNATVMTMEQIDIVDDMLRRYPEHFQRAGTAAEVRQAIAQGKIASMMGIEGGHSIENQLGLIQRFYDRGVRYMTLTHSKNVDWADSATDEPRHNGLADFGREVVLEMNRVGMLVDISHVSPATMHAALDVSRAPVIFSHSSARAICDHPRNVPDDVLKRIPANGGVVMVTFVSGFIAPTELLKREPKARGTIYDVCDHIEHVIKVAGIDHVGIGGDYDGVTSLPHGLEDVSKYPAITQILLDRGYGEEQIHKLLGGNILRVMEQAEKVAAELRAAR